MARDLNQCNFIGRLGKDPETRYMPSGDAVCNFSIAVGQSWTDKENVEHYSTEWVRITAYKQLAEIVDQYCEKGRQVFVSGKLRTRKWTDKENVEHYSTEIIANSIQLLSKPGGEASSPPPQRQAPAERPAQQRPAAQSGSGFDDFQDDIPFVTCSLAHDPIYRRLGWIPE